MSLLRYPSVFLGLLALLGGCASSQPVVIADGSTAYDVSCFQGRWACADEAARVCHGGHYVVLDESVALGIVTHDSQGSLRIQCADEYAAANAPAPAAAPAAPAARPSEVVVCRHAYDDASQLAARWSVVRGSPARVTAPTIEEFMRTCVALPETVQLCLNVAYGEKHPHTCAQTFDALDASATASLDHLLLAKPGAPRPAPSPPPPGEQL